MNPKPTQNPAPGLAPDRGPVTLLLRWAGERMAYADCAARRAMAEGRGEDSLERLLTGLGLDSAQLESALRRALRSGSPYEATSARIGGGEARIAARPRGRRIEMAVRLNGAGGPSSSPGPDVIVAALNESPCPVWLRGPDGAVLWRNRACERAALDLDAPDLRAAAATAAETRAAQRLPARDGDGAALTIAEAPDGLGMAVPSLATEAPNPAPGPRAALAEAAFDQLSMAVAAFGPDRRLVCANAAFLACWALPEGGAEDRPTFESLLDRLRDAERLPAVANYPLWREEVAAWADPGAEAPAEDDWHLADGSALRVERKVDGARRVVFSFRDITEQVALERRHRRTLAMRRKTLDALESGVALFDPDGRLRLANPAFARLWALDPLHLRLNPHVSDIPAPVEDEDAGAAWRSLLRAVTGGPAEYPAGPFRLQGRVLEARAAPMPDGSVLARIDDRTADDRAQTALRQRNEALAAAADLRAALADCVSVKLRTALTSIGGFAELALLETHDAPLGDRLSEILSAASDMARAVEEIELLAACGDPDTAGAGLSASDLLQKTADLLPRALWAADARLERLDESGGASFPGEIEPTRQIGLIMALAALDGLPPGGALRLIAGSEPDETGPARATFAAESLGLADRTPPEARLDRLRSLAAGIGATLTIVEKDGLRRITLTAAAG